MYPLRITFLVTLSFCSNVIYVNGLTDEEISKFRNGAIIDRTADPTNYRFTATGIPDHDTQQVNPHTAKDQHYNELIPKNATIAKKTTCISMGDIGFAINGVAFFNAFTDQGMNAVEGEHAEKFDSCNGHPSPVKAYHYHQLPNCLYYNGSTTGIVTQDTFLGVAIDGFPIYGPYASDLKRNVNNSDLDECHGRMVGSEYRYYISFQFPYTIGCFKGTPVVNVNTTKPIFLRINTSVVCTNKKGEACTCGGFGCRPGSPANTFCPGTSSSVLNSSLFAGFMAVIIAISFNDLFFYVN